MAKSVGEKREAWKMIEGIRDRGELPSVAPLNVKTTLNVKTAKCEKPNNR